MWQLVWFGVVMGHPKQIAPFHRAHTSSHQPSTVTTTGPYLAPFLRYRDLTWSKVADFNLPHLYFAPAKIKNANIT